MNALLIPGDTLAMSTREIAELTGKRHDNVMADCRKMLTELHGDGGVLKFQDTQPNAQNGQSYAVFMLPKRETLVLIAGYSATMRAKIIDRWMELEAGAAPSLNLRQPAQLLAVCTQLAEIVQEQQAQLAAQAPKVAFAEAVGIAENTQTVEEVGKLLGLSKVRMFRWLRTEGILMSNNLPIQKHLDGGRFRVIEKNFETPTGEVRNYVQTVVTGKGVTYLQQRHAKSLEAAIAT